MVFSFIGAVTGLTGMILSVLGFFRNRMDAVNSYFDYDKNETYIEARKAVHNLSADTVIDTDLGGKIALVIITYNTSAILVRKRQMPFWVFWDTPAKYACLTFYPKLQPYISERRKSNPLYATDFEWLYRRIVKKDERARRIR